MKRINNLKELQIEKVRIQQQQELLESRMQRNWMELKESIKPANIARETLYKAINYKSLQNLLVNTSILKGSLNYGLSFLIKRFTGKAVQKLSSFFRK